MKLSIIVPVYNAEKYIRRCLDSLLHQQMDDYEIITVNDGSKDQSLSILQEYKNKYPSYITIVDQPNQGVGAARNAGLKCVKGDYFTYVDSDDYVEANCYDEITEKALAHNLDIVIYDAYKDYGDHKTYMTALEESKDILLTPKQYMLSFPCPWNKIMKTAMVREHNVWFPENIWYEDLAMIPTLGLYATRIGYIHKPMIYYFQSENSITRRPEFNEKRQDIFVAMQFLYDHLNNTPYQDVLESIHIYHLLSESCIEFYVYNRYDLIQKAVDMMKTRFPNWKKNVYLKNESKKTKQYAYIFYHHLEFLFRIKQLFKKRKGVGK